ncbi:MAG: hypothetical protein A2Z96_04745 [Spirochaetes bacterium GWB1_48_6]|nr:MAG: hypothetical protein A2Z96_04745 [Spirochaetes bacterium GWB1_48_6]
MSPFVKLSFWVVGVIGALGVLAGCSPSTPQIIQDFTRLTYLVDPGSTLPKETLSVFIQVENKDGLEDLEKLYILNDKDEVYWTLEPGLWQRRDKGTEIWIGSNFLTSPLGEIPRGEYRILLQSKSGDRARTKFFLDSPKLADYQKLLPQVLVDGDGVTIVNPPVSYELWLASSDGQPVYTYRSPGESRILKQTFLPTPDVQQRARQLTLHRFEDRLGVSLILGPYPIAP